MDLMDAQELANQGPYVHSNLSRFSLMVRSSDYNVKKMEGLERLEKEIERLEEISEALQLEASDFLTWDGKYHENADEVFVSANNKEDKIKKYKILHQTAVETLSSDKMASILTNQADIYTQTVLENAYGTNFGGLGNIFAGPVNQVFSKQEVIDIFSTKIMQNIKGLTRKDQIVFISNVLQSGKVSSQKKLAKVIKRSLSSETGNIQKIIRDDLSSKIKKMPKINKIQQVFISAFMVDFENRLTKKDYFIDYGQKDKDYLDYKERLQTSFSKLNGKLFGLDWSNQLGKMGEDFFKCIVEASSRGTLSIELVGLLSEDRIQELNQKGIKNIPVAGKMITHHASNKESQTDMIITNNHNGKSVRVQSKFLLKSYLAYLNKNPFPGYAALQKTIDYNTLINNLQNTDALKTDEEDMLAYLIANETWFKRKESMDLDKAWGVSNPKSTLSYVQKVITRLLAQNITNFIGINLPQGKVGTLAASMNTFFLVSGHLVPTWKIIDSIINQLSEVYLKLKSSITNNSGLAKFSFSLFGGKITLNAKDYYKNKSDKVELDHTKFYTDRNLVAYGTQVGEDILKTVKVNKVGLQFNFEKILGEITK